MIEKITVELSKPLIDESADNDSDGKITKLEFIEPTIGDFLKYKMPDLIQDVKSIVEITAKLTGNRLEVIKKMSPADYTKCLEVIGGFFGDSQAT